MFRFQGDYYIYIHICIYQFFNFKLQSIMAKKTALCLLSSSVEELCNQFQLLNSQLSGLISKLVTQKLTYQFHQSYYFWFYNLDFIAAVVYDLFCIRLSTNYA